VYACVKENNQSRKNPQIQSDPASCRSKKEHGVSLEHATPYYDPERVPQPQNFYMPVQCQQCRHPPCTKVCPVKATWKEPDGIVVIDYDWCIGCRCCTAACPYGAPQVQLGRAEPARRGDEPGHRLPGQQAAAHGRGGSAPSACSARAAAATRPAWRICPVGARKFGNLLDPASEIRQVIDRKRVFVFKEELGHRAAVLLLHRDVATEGTRHAGILEVLRRAP